MSLLKRLFGASSSALRPVDVQSRLKGPVPPLVVDLRTQEEYAASHIPGSVVLPISQLSQWLHTLPRDREIICVCSFGHNSDSVTNLLDGAGFKGINMSEGMVGWHRAGLPVVTKGSTHEQPAKAH